MAPFSEGYYLLSFTAVLLMYAGVILDFLELVLLSVSSFKARGARLQQFAVYSHINCSNLHN